MMDEAAIRDACLKRAGVTEDYPFGAEVRVYKVLGKMFALLPHDEPLRISLKCDPTRAVMLRDTYDAVEAGYHLNKKHWNTIKIDGEVPDDEVLDLVEHSYQLVVKSLKKSEREQLKILED